jgi:predicted MPP superfamily phosphohydrolase
MNNPELPMPFPARNEEQLSRRRFVQMAAGLAVTGGAALAYATLCEPFLLEFVRRELPIRGLPLGLKGKQLVQISDIHVCPWVAEAYLIESLQRVSALEPDIVVYTGDFISVDTGTRAGMARVFPHLPRGKRGTVATLGNHDYGGAWDEEEWAQYTITALAQCGIPVLRNAVAEIDGLQLIGMDDLWSGRFSPREAFGRARPGKPSIVLSHNPDTLDVGDWAGYQGWILAGHTHGGQCKPPFLPPPIIPVKNPRYTAGEIGLEDGRRLYINRGLGYLHHVRFNVRPEITVFTLV